MLFFSKKNSLAFVCMMSVIPFFVSAMNDEGAPSLVFTTDALRKITTANSFGGMEFLTKDCLGKILEKVVPLSDKDSEKIVTAFTQAHNDNKETQAEYTLKKNTFVAKMTPLLTGEATAMFVRVIQKADGQKS